MMQIPNIVSTGPSTRAGQRVEDFLTDKGWQLVYRGKVRDTYGHPNYPDYLLVVATDRISIFDHVLPATIERKGEVLTALTHFWLTGPLAGIKNHLITEIPAELADLPWERCLLVRKAKVQPFELIWRAHIGGSVWKSYLANGIVSGQQLPAGLQKWQKLDKPIFTPSTKAEVGHDENITAASYFEAMGALGRDTVDELGAGYELAYAFAKRRGILILDTKFEAGNPFILLDEVLTPDSSRFTTIEGYETAMREGRDPEFYDKEPVRDWGRNYQTTMLDENRNPILGINNLKPEDPRHRVYIHSALWTEIPEAVISDASRRYLEIFEMIVGETLNEYQQTCLGIAT